MKLYTHKTLLMCGAAVWATASATASMAQEHQVEAIEQVEAPEAIIVTGTRLRSPNLESPSPITSMTEEMMGYTGKTEIRQIVAEVGALVGASGTNQLGTGESALNLRNLGESRTLTLVDGRRFVSAFGGNSAVDTNVLPLALIERVDVLTGGASAVYGADAVTGVVNFIQKKDYEGLGFDAQYGDAQRGDFRDQTYAITAGHNFDGGRGNVTVNFTYGNRPLVRASARDVSQIVVERVNNPNGPDPLYVLAAGTREGFFSDGGALIDPIGFFSGGYKGDGTPFNHGRNLVGWSGFSELGGDGPLSYRLFTNDLQPSNDRKILTVLGHYDVSDAFKPYIDLHLSDVRNRSLAQPTLSIIQPIAADTAYIPESVRAAADGAPITYNRWDFDVGNVDTRVDKRTVRIVLGAKGDLSEHLQYDISANYGKVRRRQHTANTRFYDRYLAAIDAVVDPNSGRVVCRSNLDPSSFNGLGSDVINAFDASQGAVTFTPGPNSGCVPFNPFTTDTASQAEARAWIYQPTTDYVHNSQTVLSGYLNYDTGGFFNLPGGPVSLVAGAEYRKEKSKTEFGPITGSPRAVASIQGTNIVGQYDVTEFFGEVSLPLLKDQGPFIRELTIDGAFRHSDYSTVGKTETWKVGGVFATVLGLKLRGTISEAARAPTIAELYTPQSRSIASLGTNDPCSPQSISLGTPSRRTNCEATLRALGIDPATFNPTQTTVIQTLEGGNPNLKEERSRTKTVGVVWQPDFVPGLSLSADYYNIELSDAVITPGTTAIFNACYDAPDLDNQFCALLQRDPATGFASFVKLTSVNVAKIYTSGYDFAGSYRRETGIGRFTLGGNASYLKRLELQKTVAPALTDERGLYSTSTRGSSPKWTVNLDLTWSRGPWDANYGFNYSSRTLREGFDVKGKLVLVLANEPNFATGQGDLGGSTPYGRYDYKVEQAAQRGAAGVLVIREAAWAAARTSNTHEIMDLIRPDPAETHTPVEGWIQAGIAANLLHAAGLDLQALKREAQTRAFKPVQLKGVTFSSRFTVDARKVVSQNVIGVWPGTTHPDESIVYSAHWDHLGVGQPDARGDRIYNGALDNATGTAVLMELGRAFAEGPRLERSVVFLAVAAEEKGLLGSTYYAAHPSLPLELTVGDINLDSIYPVGPSRSFTTVAAESNNLVDSLIAAGQRHGMTYTRTDSGSSFFQSDHFSFINAGVPAISVHIGADLVDGGKAAMDAWFADNRGVYHQPSDQVRPGWRYDGPASFGSMLMDAGTALANSRTWPALAEGVEFKAKRDKTAAARKN